MDIGHSDKAKKMLDKYLIGKIKNSEQTKISDNTKTIEHGNMFVWLFFPVFFGLIFVYLKLK